MGTKLKKFHYIISSFLCCFYGVGILSVILFRMFCFENGTFFFSLFDIYFIIALCLGGIMLPLELVTFICTLSQDIYMKASLIKKFLTISFFLLSYILCGTYFCSFIVLTGI